MFQKLCREIDKLAKELQFQEASDKLEKIIFDLGREQFIPLISDIGTIPEYIAHDSTEEKLYSKVSDIILSKSFQELGLKSIVLKERANSADVFAESKYHKYSLVGDAKAFRLSRTAKNQKDFKVESMDHWKGDNDYSVLVCPYFQYPKNKSQIYGQALNRNISLFSWEYLSILLEKGIKETEKINLSILWNQSSIISLNTTVANKNSCFLEIQNKGIQDVLNITQIEFNEFFDSFKTSIVKRGEFEIDFWKEKINIINTFTREDAINELICSLKLKEKIVAISKFTNSLRGE